MSKVQYIEFADQRGATSLIQQCENLVVLRTLSKAFGLAGARVGALIASETIISWVRKILSPYPLPIFSIQSALAALQQDNSEQRRRAIMSIKQQRQLLFDQLQQFPIIEKIWPSQANFLLLKCKKSIVQFCQQQGIVLRDMSARTGIENTVRVTIGSEQENVALIKLLSGL